MEGEAGCLCLCSATAIENGTLAGIQQGLWMALCAKEKKKECLQSAEIKTSASISSLEFVSI